MLNWSSDDDDFTEASNQDYREYKKRLANSKQQQGCKNLFQAKDSIGELSI